MSDYEFWKDLGNIFDSILNYQKKNAEFNSRFINPWIRLGNIFDRDDQHKEAVQAYRLALEIDPDSAQNWADLGDAQFKMGTYEEAMASYNKAVELDSRAPWPISNLALTLVTMGKCEEAIPLFLRSIELSTEDKDKAVTWNRLGNAYRKLNDYENAFLAFQQADELDGENTGFRDQLDETTESSTMVAPEEVLVQMDIEDEVDGLSPETFPDAPQVGELSEKAVTVAQVMETKIEEVPVEPEAVKAQGITAPKAAEVVEEESESLPAWLAEENLEEPVDETAFEEEPAEAEPVSRVIEEIVTLSEMNPVKEPAAEVPVETRTDRPVEELAEEVPVEEPVAVPVEEIATVEIEKVIDTSTTSMGMVETYTEFTSTPVVDPSTLEDTQPIRAVRRETLNPLTNVEALDDPAARPEVPQEVDTVEQAAPMAEGSPKVPTNEAAYEEYLKDASEPVSTLSDHIEDLHAVTPMTRVSQSGDVRIAMDTQNAHVWNELGNVYLNSSSCDDAIAAYSKAIELDRQFAWPYSNLALAYVQKGRLAEAILLYQRSIELFASDKDKAVTWNRLGNVYRRLNDYANAIAAYQMADDLDPDNATLSLRSHYGLLGNLYLEQKPNYVS